MAVRMRVKTYTHLRTYHLIEGESGKTYTCKGIYLEGEISIT
jgi:hypothetical protein